MSPGTSHLRRVLFFALLLLPLLAGGIYAAVSSTDPSAAWSAEEPAAAPGATDLVPARRAAGEASSGASFLSGGTGELVNGSKELADGTGQLSEGSKTAVTGANDLAAGMVQLQAGTGQLGDGAVKIADGVQSAVEQVQGIGLIQAQIVKEIDRVSAELEKDKSPEAAEFRNQLGGFRTQVETFKLDGGMVDQLNQLRSGSRDLANQLAVPGYGYHDGIYTATKGTKDLAAGLRQLDAGLGEAATGADKLHEGSVRVDGMAKTNKDKIGAVQRALPADPAPVAQDEKVPTFIPLLGFFIAALVTVGCSLTSRYGLIAVIAMGAILALVMATDLTLTVGLGLVGIVALSGLAAALFARGMIAVFGRRWGSYVVWGSLLLQVGVVGWVWKAASRADISEGWSIASAFLPMHYSTAALTSVGNEGSMTVLWMSVAVLGALAVFSGLTTRFAPVRVGSAGVDSAEESGE